ncbi:MAG TPA: MFS transporter [Bacillales bacterium]|nr:MFS transporter [Bacillales bacterium]
MFRPSTTVFHILIVISVVHLLNDAISALIPAMFPILEQTLSLSYTDLGLIAFAANMTSSIMQPVVGWLTDHRPSPYALPAGLVFTMLGIVGLAFAPSFPIVIIAVVFAGIGSAVFHPEGSRVAYMAAGARRGFAQSVYQVGGNAGQSLAPIITALVLVPLGQVGALWFTIPAATAVLLLIYVARWYASELSRTASPPPASRNGKERSERNKKVAFAVSLLIFFVFAQSWYRAGITNFYAFYAIEQYEFTIGRAEIYVFVFLAFATLGTFIGGPLSDKIGKRSVLFLSMAGAAPFSLLLPHVDSLLALPVLAVTGLILLTNISVSVVYAQELLPGKIGTASGLIVGLAFGLGAIGSIAIGRFADAFGIGPTMTAVSFLPLLGIFALFLPKEEDFS